MAAFSPPRLFAAWRVEAPFSAVSFFDGFCTLCYLLTRGVFLHDSACCSREDSFDECGRPRDTLSCLLFSALWLRCNQSILVQETQSVKDTDMTCSKMLPSGAHVPPEVPSGEQQQGTFPTSTRSRWRQDALQAPPQILQRTTGWHGCGPFPSDVLLGTPGVSLDLFSPNKREFKLKYLKRLFDANNSLCLQEVHGKDRLFRCWLRNFGSLVPLFLKRKRGRIGYLHSHGIWLLVTAVITL